MTTATDTFAAFVAALADGLDDDELDGAGFAVRLHVSRFHLDRIVSATAGEPPQALRCWVLLERAAYRLITTTGGPWTWLPKPATPRTRRSPGRSAAPSARHRRTCAGGRRRSGSWPPTMCTSTTGQPPAAVPQEGHHHGPADPHDRTPHLAHRRDGVEVASRLDDKALDATVGLAVDEDEQSIHSLLSRLVGQLGMWNAALANR